MLYNHKSLYVVTIIELGANGHKNELFKKFARNHLPLLMVLLLHLAHNLLLLTFYAWNKFKQMLLKRLLKWRDIALSLIIVIAC